MKDAFDAVKKYIEKLNKAVKNNEYKSSGAGTKKIRELSPEIIRGEEPKTPLYGALVECEKELFTIFNDYYKSYFGQDLYSLYLKNPALAFLYLVFIANNATYKIYEFGTLLGYVYKDGKLYGKIQLHDEILLLPFKFGTEFSELPGRFYSSFIIYNREHIIASNAKMRFFLWFPEPHSIGENLTAGLGIFLYNITSADAINILQFLQPIQIEIKFTNVGYVTGLSNKTINLVSLLKSCEFVKNEEIIAFDLYVGFYVITTYTQYRRVPLEESPYYIDCNVTFSQQKDFIDFTNSELSRRIRLLCKSE